MQLEGLLDASVRLFPRPFAQQATPVPGQQQYGSSPAGSKAQSAFLTAVAQAALKRMQQAYGIQLTSPDASSHPGDQGLQLDANAVGTAADAKELAVACLLRMPPPQLASIIQQAVEESRSSAEAVQAIAFTGLFASSLQVGRCTLV